MKKKLPLLLSIVYVASLALPPQTAWTAVGLPITAPSAVLLDGYSKHMIYAKTPYQKRAPASTVKVLTAMVVMDHLPMSRVVTIPRSVEKVQPSKIYLRRGERYRVRDLVVATLNSSANDAAEALALITAGSRAAFARKMNHKARAIGCRHSNFIQPNGLPATNQYSTAYDMALIMRHAENYPFIVTSLKKKYVVIYSLAGRRIVLRNHNKWLWRDSREVVGKTGWTRRAKHCFVGRIGGLGRKVVVSVFGSHRLWQDLKILVDYQFGKFYQQAKRPQTLWARENNRRIQMALKRAGYDPGPADGVLGPRSVSAVKAFQRSHGLQPDGQVGSLTLKKLRSY